MKSLYILILSFSTFFAYPQRITSSLPVSATTCDKRYALGVQEVLQSLRGTMSRDRLQSAQQYMIILKHHQDVDFSIQRLENTVFNNVITRAYLRLPLQKYQRCFDTATLSGTRTRAIPAADARCDKQYAVDMQQTLQRMKGSLTRAQTDNAQKYMIMVKQFQDLDFKLRSLERTTFDITTLAKLRAPLQAYQRCRGTLISDRADFQ
jgi:hypothetical protein